MSTFVLNRNYQLQLPNSFVDVERDEMEYVDGGSWTINRSTIQQAFTRVIGYISFAFTIQQIAKYVIKYGPGLAKFIMGSGPFVQIAATILAGFMVAGAIAIATIYVSGGSITLG